MDIQIGMPCKYDLICTLIGYGIAIFIIFLLFAACFALLRKPAAKKQKAHHNKNNDDFTDMKK